MFTKKEISTLTKNGFIINSTNTIAHHPSTNYSIQKQLTQFDYYTYILIDQNHNYPKFGYQKYGNNTIRGAINLWKQDVNYYIQNPNAN